MACDSRKYRKGLVAQVSSPVHPGTLRPEIVCSYRACRARQGGTLYRPQANGTLCHRKQKRKATNALFPVFRPKGPSWLDSFVGSWLSLMAAGVPVLMMPVVVDVLMGVHGGFVAVLMAIMAMSLGFVPVLMLMLVFAMAAHQSSLLSSVI